MAERIAGCSRAGRQQRADGASRVSGRSGFTLIEMLVVIIILGLLMAIAFTLAGRVTQGGRVRVTQDILRVLDQSLEAVVAAKETIPGAVYRDRQTEYKFPLADARLNDANNFDRDSDPPQPSGALYLLLASQVPEAESLLQGVDAKFVQHVQMEAFGVNELNAPLPPQDRKLRGTMVLDGFGRPIRFVHPSFQGGYGTLYRPGASTVTRPTLGWPSETGPLQLRRSLIPFDRPDAGGGWVGDADEGISRTNRPYFYSAGYSGDPGIRDDNVYTQKPDFPAESARLNR